MPAWLTPAWWDAALDLATTAEELDRPGLDVVVKVEISGGPNGGSAFAWVLSDGRPVRTPEGNGVTSPEVTFALSADDAAAVLTGTLDPNVAFMQGRLKLTGDQGTAIELLARSRSEPMRQFRERLAGTTEW